MLLEAITIMQETFWP